MLLPSSYKRRILLAVSGLSPQIVTETLYALATQADAAGTFFVPTEVHLITTLEGAQRAGLSLLSSDLGWFHKLCSDYQLTNIAFGASHIHVMCDASGQPMDDIRSAADNRAAANFINAQVRQWTADADCALHVSIAGGRKTMGFYLGYALSLHGRAQDRLSHVLVSEPFESSRDFFYPTPYSRTIYVRDNRPVDTATAQVTLAEIPFVSLRHGLPVALLSGNASFNETVQAARDALAAPSLRLDLPGRRIAAGGVTLALPPAELALLAVFARRASYGQSPLAAPACDSENEHVDEEWGRIFLREYQLITAAAAGDLVKTQDRTTGFLEKGMSNRYFSERKSKLERILKTALGPAAVHYCIAATGAKASRRYALALPVGAVEFERFERFER